MSTAAVRMVCGACGAAVGPSDVVCPSCGARLQFPGASGTACPSCGHRNPPGGLTCESCGARLVPGAAVRTESGGEERARTKKASRERAKSRTEPWMYIAGASVIALIAYIVYLAFQAPPPSSAGGAVSGAPAGSVAPMGDHIGALEQAVRDRPGDPGALLELANGLQDHREWDRAIQAYEQYLEKIPGNPDARVDLGICYFELSRVKPDKAGEYFAKATGEMEAALKGSPKHVPAAFNLGVIYLQHGDLQKSNEWFRRAIAIDKNHPLAQRAQRMLEQHSFTN